MMYQWWMSWSRAVLMVCVLCLVFVTGVVGKHSLFEGSKYVMEVTTFEMGALNVDARMCPTVMLFYADMCGHCRKFAPVYAASAEKLHEDSARGAETYSLYGRSIITSVNCMRGGNLHLCTSVNITGVPVLGLWIPRMLPSAPRTASLLDTHTFYRVTLPSGADVPTLLATAWNHQRPQGWNAENEKHCGSVVANLPNGRGEYSVAPVEPAINNFVEEHSVMASDIINGFFFMMNHEVPLSGLDTVEKVIALRVFLATVTSHLPGIGAEPLLRFLRNVTVGTKITQSEWLAQVKAAHIPIAGEPNDLHWKTCQGSSWKFRGPPCGQWLLFHSLTVNFAKPSSNTEDGGFVFSVIRGYVEHFLSCLPCRKHFLRFKPRSGECSLLALWRAHNVANRFLAEDPTAANDPMVPKVQYPTAERCPLCYTPPEEGDEDGIDLEQVTQFIFRTFHYPNPLKDDSSVNFVDYNYLNAHFPPRKVRRRRPIFSKQLVTAPYLLFPIVIACLFFVTRRHLRRSLPISRMLSGKNRHE